MKSPVGSCRRGIHSIQTGQQAIQRLPQDQDDDEVGPGVDQIVGDAGDPPAHGEVQSADKKRGDGAQRAEAEAGEDRNEPAHDIVYNPQVSEELLSDLGNLSDENIVVLVTVTVPTDLTKMTVNLQGPIIINSDEKKGAQIIVEGNDYPVRFPIYDILKARKEGN